MIPGDVISYIQMCQEEGVNLQRGMNYRLKGKHTVILMSVRSGAPYADRVEDNGKTLIYEGHDLPNYKGGPDPKVSDQPEQTPFGTPTENKKFTDAAQQFKEGKHGPESIKVYEKIKSGIWVYSGMFQLVDAWTEISNNRKVFKFKLKLTEAGVSPTPKIVKELEHNRMIPTSVKLEVWKRDKGKCRECGSHDNLHFDHIIPYSKGGSSLVAENVQLLCARHNLEKHDKIQ